MSFNLNRVILAGRLCRDPQVKLLAGTRTVAAFNLAINRRWKTADGTAKEDTTFVDIETWGRTAELVGQYLVKGSGCCVDGELRLDQWQGKDGIKHSRLKVVAESIHFVGPRRDGSAGAETAQPTTEEVLATDPGTPALAAAEDQPPF